MTSVAGLSPVLDLPRTNRPWINPGEMVSGAGGRKIGRDCQYAFIERLVNNGLEVQVRAKTECMLKVNRPMTYATRFGWSCCAERKIDWRIVCGIFFCDSSRLGLGKY